MAVDAVLNKNMAVVIGLQSTGEANTSQAAADAEDELDDWVSTPQVVLQRLIESQFPITVGTVGSADFSYLYAEVLKVTARWKTAAAAAAAAPAAPAAAAAAAAAAPASDDEDEVAITAEKTLDEIESEKRRIAELSGDLIDLTGGAASNDEAVIRALEDKNRAAKRALEASSGKRKAAEQARLREERDAVRRVAKPELLPAELDEASDAAAALVGRKVVRTRQGRLESGVVVEYLPESDVTDESCYRVSFESGEALLTAEDIAPLLVERTDGSDDDEDDFMPAPAPASKKRAAPGAAPKAAEPPKKAAKPVQVGGRTLRGGARGASRVVVIDSSGSDDDSDESGSESGSASGSDESGPDAMDVEDETPLKAKPKKASAVILSDSDDEPVAKRAHVKEEGGAGAAAAVKEEDDDVKLEVPVKEEDMEDEYEDDEDGENAEGEMSSTWCATQRMPPKALLIPCAQAQEDPQRAHRRGQGARPAAVPAGSPR